MNRNLVVYLSMLVAGIVLIGYLITQGAALEVNSKTSDLFQPFDKSLSLFQSNITHNMTDGLARLLMQMLVIIVVARLLGWLMRKIGQPSVLGDIIAGIALGPSLLGNFFPEVSGFIFPVESLGNLKFISQIGLILFMFVIGMELDMNLLRKSAGSVFTVSHGSILVAFGMGIALSLLLYAEFAPPKVPFLSFSLFMGVSLSIAAFPVLARILLEKGLIKTPLGSFVIATAAVDDFTAWSLLAAVIAIAKAGDIVSALMTIGIATLYVLFMIMVVRPILRRVSRVYLSREHISRPLVAGIFGLLILSSWLTETIGIHALFGAFMAGVIMPRETGFTAIITEKIEDIALLLFLPLFFVYTGLRTEIGLINDSRLILLTLFIIVCATVGKFGGTLLASRLIGKPWKESFIISSLMNTRGLMELVVLNIGFEMGIISGKLFAMMVIMALATTFMTGPLLNLIDFISGRSDKKQKKTTSNNRIMFAYGPPAMGVSLLRLCSFLRNSFTGNEIGAIHITPQSDLRPDDAERFEKESFAPIFEEAEVLGVKVNSFYKATDKISREISQTAKNEAPDLLLLGSAKNIFDENKLGGVVYNVLEDVKSPCGVFIDHGLEEIRRLGIIVNSEEDTKMISLLSPSLKAFDKGSIYVADMSPNRISATSDFKAGLPSRLIIYQQAFPDMSDREHTLWLTSVNTWASKPDIQSRFAEQSVLLIRS